MTNDVPDDVGASPAAVRSHRIAALVDTGATITLIDRSIVDDLRLPLDGKRSLVFPNTTVGEERTVHRVEVRLHADFGSERSTPWPDVVRASWFDAVGKPFRMVLGMDVLSRGDLALERGGAVRFGFDAF